MPYKPYKSETFTDGKGGEKTLGRYVLKQAITEKEDHYLDKALKFLLLEWKKKGPERRRGGKRGGNNEHMDEKRQGGGGPEDLPGRGLEIPPT